MEFKLSKYKAKNNRINSLSNMINDITIINKINNKI